MEITDAVAKANNTVNGVLDVFKKRWFIALLLWGVLATQLAALWAGRPAPEVLRAALIDSLTMQWVAPVLDGLDAALAVIVQHQLLWGVIYLIVCALAVASMSAFWKGGKVMADLDEVDIAPVNVMLRFAIFSTLASFAASLEIFVVALAIAGILYALAAAGTVPPHQRLAMFSGAVVVFLLSFAVAAMTPIVLVTVGLWNALS